MIESRAKKGVVTVDFHKGEKVADVSRHIKRKDMLDFLERVCKARLGLDVDRGCVAQFIPLLGVCRS